MAASLSNIVDNLKKGIHQIKYKDVIFIYFFEYESVKYNLIKYKCLYWNKHYSKNIEEELIKTFKNTFDFSNNDINKFLYLLRKGVYPYEYMDEWEKFNETSLPEKEELFSD